MDIENKYYWYINFISFIFLSIFMIVHCKTGIYRKGTFCANRHKILKNYYKGNFKCDLIVLCVVLFNIIFVPLGSEDFE